MKSIVLGALLVMGLSACMQKPPSKKSETDTSGNSGGNSPQIITYDPVIELDISKVLGANPSTNSIPIYARISNYSSATAPSVIFTVTPSGGGSPVSSTRTCSGSNSAGFTCAGNAIFGSAGDYDITAQIKGLSISDFRTVTITAKAVAAPFAVTISTDVTSGYVGDAVKLTGTFTKDAASTETVKAQFFYSEGSSTVSNSLGVSTDCNSASVCTLSVNVPTTSATSIYYWVQFLQGSQKSQMLKSSNAFAVTPASAKPTITLSLPSSDCCVVGQKIRVRADVQNAPSGYDLASLKVKAAFGATAISPSTDSDGVYYEVTPTSSCTVKTPCPIQVKATGNPNVPVSNVLNISARALKPGEIDLAFGQSGTAGVIPDLVDNSIDYGFTAIVADPDGKSFYAAGWMKATRDMSSSYTNKDGKILDGTTFMVAKFKVDGTIDTSFNGKGYFEVPSKGGDVASVKDLAVETLKGCRERTLVSSAGPSDVADIWSKALSVVVSGNNVVMSGFTRIGPDDVSEIKNGSSKINPFLLPQCEAMVAVNKTSGKLSTDTFGSKGIVVLSATDEIKAKRAGNNDDSQRIKLTDSTKVGIKRDYFGGRGLAMDASGNFYVNMGVACNKESAAIFDPNKSNPISDLFAFLSNTNGKCETGVIKVGGSQATPLYATPTTRNPSLPSEADWIHDFSVSDRLYSVAAPFKDKTNFYFGGVSNGWRLESNAFVETYRSFNGKGQIDSKNGLRFDCSYFQESECSKQNVFDSLNTGKRALQVMALSTLNAQPVQGPTNASINLIVAAGVGYTNSSSEKPGMPGQSAEKFPLDLSSSKYNSSYVMILMHENNDVTKGLKLFPEFGINGLRFYDLSAGANWPQQLRGMSVDVDPNVAFSRVFIGGTVVSTDGKKRMSVAEIQQSGNVNSSFGAGGSSILRPSAPEDESLESVLLMGAPKSKSLLLGGDQVFVNADGNPQKMGIIRKIVIKQ